MHQCFRDLSFIEKAGVLLLVLAKALLAFGFWLLMHLSAAGASPHAALGKVSEPDMDRLLGDAFNLTQLDRTAGTPHDRWRLFVEDERDRLTELLRSQGYLDASVELVSEDQSPLQEDSISEGADRVLLLPSAGRRYLIGSMEVAGVSGSDLQGVQEDVYHRMTGVVGAAANSDTLFEFEKELLWQVSSASYPFARVVARAMTPDSSRGVVLARIEVETGPLATFGPLIFDGLTNIDKDELAGLAPFAAGDRYDPARLGLFYSALVEHPTIGRVRMELASAPDNLGQVPIHVTIQERPRTPQELARTEPFGWIVVLLAASALFARQVWHTAHGSRGNAFGIGMEFACVVLFGLAIAVLAYRTAMLAGI